MEEQHYKAFRANVEQIERILTFTEDLLQIFSQQELKAIKDIFSLMVTHMERLARDETVIATDQDMNLIHGTIRMLLNAAFERPIPLIFRDLARTLMILTFNWNGNVGKAEPLKRDIDKVRRVVEAKTTLDEAIETAKMLIAKLRAEVHYRPPAFELSKHYLETLTSEEEKST